MGGQIYIFSYNASYHEMVKIKNYKLVYATSKEMLLNNFGEKKKTPTDNFSQKLLYTIH
jgi:hypothetical protein